MNCPNCSKENRDAARYCDECGFPLVGAIADAARSVMARASSLDAEFAGAASSASSESASRQGNRSESSDREAATGRATSSESGRRRSGNVEVPSPGISGDFLAQSRMEAEQQPSGGAAGDEPSGDAAADDVLSDAASTSPLADKEGSDALLSDGEEDSGESGLQGSFDDGEESDAVSDARSTSGLDELVDATDSWQGDEEGAEKGAEEGAESETYSSVVMKGSGRSNYLSPDESLKKKRRHTGLVAFFGLVVALLAVAGIAALVNSMGSEEGTAVPDVVGMSLAEARETLENSGFSVSFTETVSDEADGIVLSTAPAANELAEEGSEVVLTVSVARTVPDVVGMSQEDAEEALADSGYSNISVVLEKADGEAGLVLSVSPEAGEAAVSSAEIVLTVVEAYSVPDVVGMAQADAQSTLEAENYVVSFVYTPSSDVDDGTVISTDPVEGTQLEPGSTVTVYVADQHAAELIERTSQIISSGLNLLVGDSYYTVVSLDSVVLVDENTVSYSFMGVPYTYMPGDEGSTAVSVSGELVFDEEGNVESGNPPFVYYSSL